MHEFFSGHFPLHGFFFVFPHPIYHFSNGPSLIEAGGATMVSSRDYIKIFK